MLVSRTAYSFDEKTWWKDLYQQSGFTNRRNFLRQVVLEVDHKAGPLYVKVKKRRSPVPAYDTFMKWFYAVAAAKIASNSRSKKKKARSAKFPLLDSMIMNFINKAETYLSAYWLGITWATIQVKAKHFGKELNDRGLMTDEEYGSFKFSRGWIEGLRKRKDLKCIKLVGEANTLSEEAYWEVIPEFRDSLHDLMETHNVPA